ncbi:MAG: hypothetical protein IPI58_03130 [Alphaproteobacteria bacterium]|nr:MAG: hypothetical protein IPI58_03130 [Alphaproteobacteria bacterium]
MKNLLPLVAAVAFMAPMASHAATVVPYYSGTGYYSSYYASPIAYSAPVAYASPVAYSNYAGYGYNAVSWSGSATVPVFNVSGSPILTAAGLPVANYTRPIAYTAPSVSYVAPTTVATPVSYVVPSTTATAVSYVAPVAPARMIMGSPVVTWGEVIGESRY